MDTPSTSTANPENETAVEIIMTKRQMYAAISIVTIIAIFFSAWSLWLISRQKSLSRLVRGYFYCEFRARLFLVVLYLLIGIAEIFGQISSNVNWLSVAAGYIYESVNLAVPCYQLGLSTNRFFAIAFMGRFYAVVSRAEIAQLLGLLIFSFLFCIPVIFPACNADYQEIAFTFSSVDDSCNGYIKLLSAMPYLMGGPSIGFDIFVYRRRRRMRRPGQGEDKLMKRLHRQLILNHVSTLIAMAASTAVAELMIDNEVFKTFLTESIYMPMLTTLQGVVLIWFFGSLRGCRHLPKTVSREASTRNTHAPLSISVRHTA